jgi:hypothetical protein
MKYKKDRKEEKREDYTPWFLFGVAFFFFFLALAAFWHSAENSDRNLSLRIDRLETDNALQQRMIKELGQKARGR